MTLQEDFKQIDVEHSVHTKLVAEVELLRLLLAQSRKDYVSVQDVWNKQAILNRYPDFKTMYGLE